MAQLIKSKILSLLFLAVLASIFALSLRSPLPARAADSTLTPPQASGGCQSPEYHQFDFWIGDWEVQNPAGKVVGHNLVASELNGCLVVEHWNDSAGKILGSSFNYYDTRDKKWHQLYLSNSGRAGDYPAMAGEFRDNKMTLLTDPHDGPVSRWTWYVVSPGHVRQMSEQIQTDKSWQITWDSIYVKK